MVLDIQGFRKPDNDSYCNTHYLMGVTICHCQVQDISGLGFLFNVKMNACHAVYYYYCEIS